jgi:hypothetical protein
MCQDAGQRVASWAARHPGRQRHRADGASPAGLRRAGPICEAAGMAGPDPSFRQRSSAAIVMTRPDPLPEHGRGTAPPAVAGRDWQWLWWMPLALLVAGAWALLLFGDSLTPPPPG